MPHYNKLAHYTHETHNAILRLLCSCPTALS
jgi:hypothetical protein